MERTVWTDERIDDAFTQLREEIRDMRAEMRAGFADIRTELRGEVGGLRRELAQLRIFMLAGLVTILAAVIGLQG